MLVCLFHLEAVGKQLVDHLDDKVEESEKTRIFFFKKNIQIHFLLPGVESLCQRIPGGLALLSTVLLQDDLAFVDPQIFYVLCSI